MIYLNDMEGERGGTLSSAFAFPAWPSACLEGEMLWLTG